MPTVIAHHDVTDKDHWLSSSKREEVFGPLGVTGIRTFIDPQNPNRVAILMEVPDMDRVMAAMQNPEMGAAMEHDGVKPETLVILSRRRPGPRDHPAGAGAVALRRTAPPRRRPRAAAPTGAPPAR